VLSRVMSFATDLTDSNSTYHVILDDFFIQRIGEETAARGEFWQLSLNFRRANLGGGQMRITTGDNVLWALIPVGSRCDRVILPRPRDLW